MITGPEAPAGTPADSGFHMPAEWAPHKRTWMCWPCREEAWHGSEGLSRAKGAYARVARTICAFEPVVMAARAGQVEEARRACGDGVEIFAAALDDSWTRDSGPTFLAGRERSGVAWRFNAWGKKYPDYEADAAFAPLVLKASDARCFRAPLVCEGGAIHTDGEGTLLTTEQTLRNANRNPRLPPEAIETILSHYLGVSRVIWLGAGFSDIETDGHVDNIACFAAPGRVILGIPPRAHPDFEPVADARRRLAEARDAKGRALEIVEIEQPRKERNDWRGRPLAGSYVNFYIANGAVIMPGFDDGADEAARAVIRDCFPGRTVRQIDVLDIVEGGGGIHCITQQEPA